MQLWTKKVVMTRVINDPMNFRTFPIVVRLIFIVLRIKLYSTDFVFSSKEYRRKGKTPKLPISLE